MGAACSCSSSEDPTPPALPGLIDASVEAAADAQAPENSSAEGSLDAAVSDDAADDALDAATDTPADLDAAIDAAEIDASPDAAEDAALDGPAFDAAPDGPADAEPDSGAPDSSTAPDAGAEPLTVYLDPSGDDSLDGLAADRAVRTMARVHAIVAGAAYDGDVEVRIRQGTYSGQSVKRTYYHPDHSIRFMPVDYHGGGIDSIAGRPVSDGEGASYWFRLDARKGEPTNLQFIYLQIQRYVQYGILLYGNRDDLTGGWNGENRVYGCLFADIGNLASAGDGGYAALDLVNSKRNTIRNNHFVGIENQPAAAALMHGVYLAHGSSHNVVESNRFEWISGDPVGVRDDSSFNTVRSNRFIRAGFGDIRIGGATRAKARPAPSPVANVPRGKTSSATTSSAADTAARRCPCSPTTRESSTCRPGATTISTRARLACTPAAMRGSARDKPA